MADQVQALEARGVRATYLASTLEAPEMRRRMARMARQEFALAYVAPERLAFPASGGLIREIDCPWWRSTRLTASASGATIFARNTSRSERCSPTCRAPGAGMHGDGDADRARRDPGPLGLPPIRPRSSGALRANLALRAAEIVGRRERERLVDGALSEALEARSEGADGHRLRAHAQQADEESERLAERGWRARSYHAGLDGGRAISCSVTSPKAARGRGGHERLRHGIDRPDVRA